MRRDAEEARAIEKAYYDAIAGRLNTVMASRTAEEKEASSSFLPLRDILEMALAVESRENVQGVLEKIHAQAEELVAQGVDRIVACGAMASYICSTLVAARLTDEDPQA